MQKLRVLERKATVYKVFKPFQANISSFLSPLKTSENQTFSGGMKREHWSGTGYQNNFAKIFPNLFSKNFRLNTIYRCGHPVCSSKKLLWKILQHSRKNTELIFQNSFFVEYIWTAGSVCSNVPVEIAMSGDRRLSWMFSNIFCEISKKKCFS